MDKRLERILPRVQKPARYVGGEYNAVKKDPARVDTRIAFCFPDTYEIGMSNLGMRILYGVMNNMEGVWCQRVFAPWGDMEEEMRRIEARPNRIDEAIIVTTKAPTGTATASGSPKVPKAITSEAPSPAAAARPSV